MVRVAFHALSFLGIEASSPQTTSIRDRSTPQTYLPSRLLFVLFQLYADSSSIFDVSGIGSEKTPTLIVFRVLSIMSDNFMT